MRRDRRPRHPPPRRSPSGNWPTTRWRCYLSDTYTIGANLAGLPALSLPCGFTKGLPIGLHLLAPPLAEANLLRAARMYEAATDWHEKVPPLQDRTGL